LEKSDAQISPHLWQAILGTVSIVVVGLLATPVTAEEPCFDAFANCCEGRLSGEVFDSFIAIAARVLNEAAKIIHTDDPNSPGCPLCIAVESASVAVHALAKAEGRRSDTDVRSLDKPRVLNADDIPSAITPEKSPWRSW
jgi:hypothetical protein